MVFFVFVFFCNGYLIKQRILSRWKGFQGEMLSEIIETKLALHSTACFFPLHLKMKSSDLSVLNSKMLKVKKFTITVTKLYGKARTGKNTVLVCVEAQREVRGSSPTIGFLDEVIK